MSTNLDTSGYMVEEYGTACFSEGFLDGRRFLPGKPRRYLSNMMISELASWHAAQLSMLQSWKGNHRTASELHRPFG
jgi:hypothetical protein